MPRKKSTPERNQRLTALLSEQEMNKAKRLVKKIDGIQNLSELVRNMIEEKAKSAFARQPRTAKASQSVSVETVTPVKPAKKGRPRKNATNGVKARTGKRATEKAAIVVAETANRRAKKGAGANGLTKSI